MNVARAWLVIGWLAMASGLGCNSPAATKATETKGSEGAPNPASANAEGASPAAPEVPAPPEPPPKPDPSLQLEVKRVYQFRGIGRGEGPASLMQENLAETFTAGVTECVKQHGLRGRFGIMLLTKPDKGELEFNGLKGPNFPTKAFVDCTRPTLARAQMPEGERFDGMLIIEYEAK